MAKLIFKFIMDIFKANLQFRWYNLVSPNFQFLATALHVTHMGHFEKLHP